MRGHEKAVWAGVASFFATLLAIGTFNIISPDRTFEYLSAIVVSVITAGSVYAKQRYDDARKEEEKKNERRAGNDGI